MRRVFLILMIALLPLRGWMGDAMAMAMTAPIAPGAMVHVSLQNPVATSSIANYVDLTGAIAQFDIQVAAPAHPDCPGHSTQASAAADSNAATDLADCKTCGLCQICHTVALPGNLFGAAPFHINPPAPLPLGSARFASALPAPSLKPPIS
jgi:hypothetical protein